jgi:chitodextrinase
MDRHKIISVLALVGIAFASVILMMCGWTVQSQSVTLTLTWTAPGDDGNVGIATAYDIRYSTDPALLVNSFGSAAQVSNAPPPDTAGSSQTVTVSGLEPSTTYYFALKTVDEQGNWSGLSNVASGTTDDLVPPADVTDLTVQ